MMKSLMKSHKYFLYFDTKMVYTEFVNAEKYILGMSCSGRNATKTPGAERVKRKRSYSQFVCAVK